MTPHDIHCGLAEAKWQQRVEVLRAAYHAHPERFPRGIPLPPPLPTAAWINKPLTPAAAPMLTASEGVSHERGLQISDPDCLIRLDNFRWASSRTTSAICCVGSSCPSPSGAGP